MIATALSPPHVPPQTLHANPAPPWEFPECPSYLETKGVIRAQQRVSDVHSDWSVPTAIAYLNRGWGRGGRLTLTCIPAKPNSNIVFHPKFRGLMRMGFVWGKEEGVGEASTQTCAYKPADNQRPLL